MYAYFILDWFKILNFYKKLSKLQLFYWKKKKATIAPVSSKSWKYFKEVSWFLQMLIISEKFHFKSFRTSIKRDSIDLVTFLNFHNKTTINRNLQWKLCSAIFRTWNQWMNDLALTLRNVWDLWLKIVFSIESATLRCI